MNKSAEAKNNFNKKRKIKVVAKKDKKIVEKDIRRYPAKVPEGVKAILAEARKREVRERQEKLIDDVVIYLKDRLSGRKDESPKKIDFRQLSFYANPAIDTVEKNIGVYNPDTIDVTVYEKMRIDPQLAAGSAMIKLPIMALPWRIESDDQDIAAFCTYAFKRIWKSSIRSILTAVDFGFAAHEKIWERLNIIVQSMTVTKGGQKQRKRTHYNGDAVLLKELKPMYPSSVSMTFDKDVFTGITQQAAHGETVEVPARKCFIYTHDGEFGNKFGRSRLKPAYKTWYWKELLYQFMLQYYERRGSPPVVVTAPPGVSEDSEGNTRDNLLIALDLGASFINNSVGALPYEESKSGRENMWSVDFLKDDRRGEMFIDAIKHLDAKCFLALWVPENLGTREGGGSFAETTVILDLFLMSEKALVAEIEAHVNKYILPQLVSFNFPKPKRIPAYFKMDQLDWNRRLHIKEIFIEMLRNIDTFVQSGITPKAIPDFDAMAGILEIPLVAWEDTVDGSPQISPTQPGNGKKVAVRRRSDTSRTETRQTIKPGTKPAVQQRARITQKAAEEV